MEKMETLKKRGPKYQFWSPWGPKSPKGSPTENVTVYLGIARKGGGGVSTLARMVWGNFLGKIFLDFGGV